jgi:transcriptional regulator of acetoin/glycerol metabolism
VRCRQNVIAAENLPSDFLRYCEMHALPPDISPEDKAEAIRRALNQAGGNKTEGALLLGMSRRTFYRKLEKLGIHPEE